MKSLIVRFVKEDRGQDLIEYALLAAFLSVAAAVGATAAGLSLNDWYTKLNTKIIAMGTKLN